MLLLKKVRRFFYEQLQQLNELIKQEWISPENCAEDFQELGPKIVLV